MTSAPGGRMVIKCISSLTKIDKLSCKSLTNVELLLWQFTLFDTLSHAQKCG